MISDADRIAVATRPPPSTEENEMPPKTEPEPSAVKTIEQMEVEMLQHRLTSIADRFSRIAIDVQATCDDLPASTSYTDAIGRLQDNIAWAVANMNLGALSGDAGRAERAKVAGE
jgi:hypothetical protein